MPAIVTYDAMSTPYPDPSQSATYARMSQLNVDGERIDEQITITDTYAAAHELTIVERFVDNGASAWREGVQRPGFDALMVAIRAGKVRTVLVWRESRITRDVGVGDLFEKAMKAAGARLISTDGKTSTVYDFTRSADCGNWRSAVAQSTGDSDLKSENVRAARRRKEERAEYMGGPVGFGWRSEYRRNGSKWSIRWLVVPEEAQELRRIAEEVRKGTAVNAICRDLHAKGITTNEGKPIVPTTLRGYLRHPRIAGLFATGGTTRAWVTDGRMMTNMDPILTVDEWGKTVKALDVISGRHRSTGTRVRHLWAGFISCHKCAGKFIRGTTRRGEQDEFSSWRHKAGRGSDYSDCDLWFSFSATPLEALLEDLVSAYLARHPWTRSDSASAVEDLRRERLTVLADLDGADTQLEAGEISPRTHTVITRQLESRITDIDQQIEAGTRATVQLDPADAVRAWGSDDLKARRRVLSAILDTVAAYPDPNTSDLRRISPKDRAPYRDRLDVRWLHQE
ncbi:recombinase family protein [Frankia sp. AiPs1]|uniref:recombinase family protein n=1 Tax=Frankia sp. AiPs1 TaxID=573493 RepID=UPI002044651D|nr:recombinase family protein [Frankia sp. AiPs1]MCM3920737.1 recombinase family protein [Frankia sp. AiPs1]